MFKRLLPIILFVLAVDLIAIQAPLTIFGASLLLYIGWFGATALVLSSLILYFNFQLRERSGMPRQALMNVFFMLFFPKVIMSLLLLVEDAVRLVKLAGNGILSLTAGGFRFGVER